MLSHSALAGGQYLVVTVSDQGTGITGDVMEHLFEPFFTTRGDRQGTGLGLAVVHGVVTELQGGIDVARVQVKPVKPQELADALNALCRCGSAAALHPSA